VRPNHSLAEVEPRSVIKKMKDKAFARAVNREDMIQGAAELGLPLDEHVANIIAALQRIAPELGL
jgi:predicted hydrolase (HD superfamily)